MKLQNLAVIFIVIIMPIALVLSIYTGNLIDVANKQAEYDSLLLNSTYDAVRAYQMNTLNNSYEAETNSKIRDINASVNSFFNSLAAGLSQSGFGKAQLTDYVPAMLYTLYDGYYVYGVFDNVVNIDKGIKYDENNKITKEQYGLKPYIYYSCEYASNNYDLIVNYTLDNYITVSGTYKDETGKWINIAQSGYFINYNNVTVPVNGDGPADFANKQVTLYKGKSNEVVIKPERLGETIIAYDQKLTRDNINNYDYKAVLDENGKAKYFNYIIYNNIKYYLDTDIIQNGSPIEVTRDGVNNTSFNMTYDGIPIFFLDGNERTYISRSTFDELKSFLGVGNDSDMYSSIEGEGCYRDVNAYYYYYRSVKFSRSVEPALKQIDLGETKITDELGNNISVIASNIPYDENGNLNSKNVIKTESYHIKYTNEKGVESHTKTTYDNSKIFDLEDTSNDPELESSSFNLHRVDVIISSIESSLITTIANFNSHMGATYDYAMPTLTEEEWDRICNNITVISFMQGLTIGNYKYYSSYAIVANTKVKDYINKNTIYVQEDNNEDSNLEYHNPRCEEFNEEFNSNEDKRAIGYKSLDYDRQGAVVPSAEGSGGQQYYFYLQQKTGGYECIVSLNGNSYSTDELLSGKKVQQTTQKEVNNEIRRAYITALAREKGSSYKTYGFLNESLQVKTTASAGEAVYTVHYYYQDYNYETNTPLSTYSELNNTYTSTALIGTNIARLNMNTTPNTGYTWDNQIRVYNQDTEKYDYLNNGNNTLQANKATDIGLYFNVNLNNKKDLYYNIETYLWNKDIVKFDFIKTDTITEQKWINANNELDVNIPEMYQGINLIYTNPAGYEGVTKKIATGSNIQAYYSDEAEFLNRTYTVRYHSNNGTGTMEENTYRFFERNSLRMNRFSMEGFGFKGWSLNPDDSEIKYKDTEVIVYLDDTDMKVENGEYYLDLYAQWEKSSYQISYQPNGATEGVMENSTHEYGVSSKLRKNEYRKIYNIKINIGPANTNFYTGNFGVWGDATTKLTYDQSSNEYTLEFPNNSARYTGMYYTDNNAIIKAGKTATISYEIYPNRDVTIALKYQNSIVGQPINQNQQNLTPELIKIPANQWSTVYFTYTNNSNNNIYDYSILGIEDTNSSCILKIKNPKIEMTNAQMTRIDEQTIMAKIEGNFLNWTYNNKTYQDEEEILNLTTQNNSLLNMTAQWDKMEFYLPELVPSGYEFVGWVDKNGKEVDEDKPIDVTGDDEFSVKMVDEVPPEVKLNVISTTTRTITVRAEANDIGSGMIDAPRYIYSIKKLGEPDSLYKTFEGGELAEYTFNNLDEGTSYNLKVEVISDREENNGIATNIATTRNLTGSTIIKRQFWNKNENDEGTAYIEFAINPPQEGVYIEYRLGINGTWTKGDTINGVHHQDTIYTRLTDGVNYLNSASFLILDQIQPSLDIIDVTAVENRPNSVAVNVNAYDGETGLGKEPKYIYSIKKQNEQNYRVVTETTSRSYNYTGLEQNTTYNIKVGIKDLAGNLKETVITVTTTYTYKIFFNGNGSTSGNMTEMNCIKDIAVTLNKNEYLRSGYKWLYWEYNGNTYFDMQQVMNLSEHGENVTLNATWKINRVYIVQNGVPQVRWEIAQISGCNSARIEWASGGQYGFSHVGQTADDGYGTGRIDVMGLVTSSPVDLTEFTKVVFAFSRWARDGGANGYYRTCAGIYSNKVVGEGAYSSWQSRPPSMIAGWLCNQIVASTQTLQIPAGVTSAYIGMASGGGWYGNGSIAVTDIYLTSD